MPTMLTWFGHNLLARIAASAVMFYTLWTVTRATGEYLPWLIVALAWVMEYLSFQEGVLKGAKGWDNLSEKDRAKLREIMFGIENED